MTKAELSRILEVPYQQVCIYFKLERIAREKGISMSLEDITKKYSKPAPKGDILADVTTNMKTSVSDDEFIRLANAPLEKFSGLDTSAAITHNICDALADMDFSGTDI